MFKVAVCDDELSYCKKTKNTIAQICVKYREDFHVDLYQNPKLLIYNINEKKEHYDMLLLDICMDVLNGIETAKEIRKTDENLNIIFVTSSPDYVYSGYDVEAVGYLVKPLDIKIFEKTITRILNKKKHLDTISLKTRGNIYNVALKDILFLESNKKKVRIVTLDQEITVYGKLSEYSEMLPKNCFIFCHKSYIVNMMHIKNMSTRFFWLSSSATIPISHSYYSKAKINFLKYLDL